MLLKGSQLLPDTERTGNPGAPKPTVAVGVFAEVLLVIFFSIVELWSLPDFCGDCAKAMLCQNLPKGERMPSEGFVPLQEKYLCDYNE